MLCQFYKYKDKRDKNFPNSPSYRAFRWRSYNTYKEELVGRMVPISRRRFDSIEQLLYIKVNKDSDKEFPVYNGDWIVELENNNFFVCDHFTFKDIYEFDDSLTYNFE